MAHLKAISSQLLPFLAILFIGLFCYYQTFHYPFELDDRALLLSNDALKKPVVLHDLLSRLIEISYGQRTRIVGFATFLLNYKLHGFNVFGYHLFNFFIHIGTSFSVFWFFQLLLDTPRLRSHGLFQHKKSLSLVASLIFVAHPVQTQAVTYISQRFASLATLFYILSLCFYIKGRFSQRTPSASAYFFSSGLSGLLGIFTKEIVISLPLQILLIESFLMREPLVKSHISLQKPLAMFKNIRPIAIIFLIFIFVCTIPFFLAFSIPSFLAFHMPSESHDGDMLTAYTYIMTEIRVIRHLFLLFLFPFNQNVDYDFPMSKSFWEVKTSLSFFFLLAILSLAINIRKKYRALTFGIFWFFLTISVEFIPRQNVIFEHKLYLTSVGLCLALVSLVFELIKTPKKRLIIFTMTILLLSLLTFQRNKIWKNEITLWQDVIQKSPNKSRPYANLGSLYLDRQEYATALPLFSRALSLKPDNADVAHDLGFTYMLTAEQNKALEYFNYTLKVNPKHGRAYLSRGILLNGLRQWDRAIDDLKEATTYLQGRDKMYAYSNLGIAFTAQRNFEFAFRAFNRALEIEPKYWEARINRGDLYLELNQPDLALADYSVLIPSHPMYAKVHVNRGIIFFNKGQIPEALQAYQKAITLNPELIEAYFNRAILYQTENDFASSLSDLNKVLELDPLYWEAYQQRAYIYFKQNDLESALEDYNRVLINNPLNKTSLYYRSLVYYKKGEFDKAWDDVTNSLHLGYQVNDSYLNKLKSLLNNPQDM